jgi:hypothetical protein
MNFRLDLGKTRDSGDCVHSTSVHRLPHTPVPWQKTCNKATAAGAVVRERVCSGRFNFKRFGVITGTVTRTSLINNSKLIKINQKRKEESYLICIAKNLNTLHSLYYRLMRIVGHNQEGIWVQVEFSVPAAPSIFTKP